LDEIGAKVACSAEVIRSEIKEIKQTALRISKEITRVGSMFGSMQFCYAEKPGGTEPGFRAIDLNEVFFQDLERILSDINLLPENKVLASEKKKLEGLRDALKIEGLERKQWIFSSFVTANRPHDKDQIVPGIQWLCKEIKDRVARNSLLSAWMYKFDYAEGQKERIKTNKEALREFVGTRLAGIFSAQNQNQDMLWLKGRSGVHLLLACKWKNDLHELSEFLHGGSEPDYNGILIYSWIS
jgi:hypothetical protein